MKELMEKQKKNYVDVIQEILDWKMEFIIFRIKLKSKNK